MTLIKVCSLALIGVVLCVMLRQWRADWLPFVRIAILILFGTLLIGAATPLLEHLQELMRTDGISEHTALLFKGLGIALLTQVAAQICRECGESGIADGVELTGKLELLLLCIPLMNEILSLAKELLTGGGGL